MIKDKDILQFDYDGNWNGYSKWGHGTFESCNSGNILGVDYYNYDEILSYRI